MGWHARCFVFCCTPETQLVWIHYFVMKQEQNDFNNFQCCIVCSALANCPHYHTFLCINLSRVHQLAYCSCNLCSICTKGRSSCPHFTCPQHFPYCMETFSKHVVQLAFKSNLFHESSLQVLLLIISDAQSTPCTHFRQAQTPFTHHY